MLGIGVMPQVGQVEVEVEGVVVGIGVMPQVGEVEVEVEGVVVETKIV
jgi:hypothetical protein